MGLFLAVLRVSHVEATEVVAAQVEAEEVAAGDGSGVAFGILGFGIEASGVVVVTVHGVEVPAAEFETLGVRIDNALAHGLDEQVIEGSDVLEPAGTFERFEKVAGRMPVGAFASQVIARHGAPDILVNNSGTIKRPPVAEHPDEMWFEVIDVNLNAQFLLSRAIGAAMIARGSGKIIFTASLLTFQSGVNVPGYAASKGGIGQLTKALANEWASKGVNAIAPGYISTDNTEALREDAVRSQQILARIPAGRWGDLAGFKGPGRLSRQSGVELHQRRDPRRRRRLDEAVTVG